MEIENKSVNDEITANDIKDVLKFGAILITIVGAAAVLRMYGNNKPKDIKPIKPINQSSYMINNQYQRNITNPVNNKNTTPLFAMQYSTQPNYKG